MNNIDKVEFYILKVMFLSQKTCLAIQPGMNHLTVVLVLIPILVKPNDAKNGPDTLSGR